MHHATRALTILVAVALSACGDGPSSPTEPTGQTSAATSTMPIIVGIGGTPFGTGEQTVTLFGRNFQAGLSVIVSFVGETSIEYSGSRVRVDSDALVTVVAALPRVGQYTAQVRNPGGTLSNAFGFQVQTGTPSSQGPPPTSGPAPVPSPSPVPGPTAFPSIDAISPERPAPGPADQRLVVSGSGFETGLTVTVLGPTGGATTVGGAQIQHVSSTRFEMVIALRDPGLYTLRVTNPDGRSSNAFVLVVPVPAVSITSVQPGNPLASTIEQRMIVFGSGLQPGLTVSVGRPAGGPMTLAGSQIQNVSPTRFEMLITLADPGTYTLRVTNPDGGPSNVFSFTVTVGAVRVASVIPLNPVSSPTEQRLVVTGANFQTGLGATLARAGGGTITVGGSQIRNVTSTRFEMLVVLRDVGSYGLSVTNPDGSQSNVFSFFVR